MDKVNIFENELNKYGICAKDIIAAVNKKTGELDLPIFIYSSKFEKLGNDYSDLDIYVIGDSEDISNYEVFNTAINGLSLDIEYWRKSTLTKYYTQLKNGEYSMYDSLILKVLQRISISVQLQGEISSPEYLNIHEIESLVIDNYARSARAHYDDGRKLWKSSDYLPAIDEIRYATIQLVGALNAKNGHPNLKQKWNSKLFIKYYPDNDLVEDYKKIMYFYKLEPEEEEKYLEKIADFFNELITKLFY